jgi:hypothetical protein
VIENGSRIWFRNLSGEGKGTERVVLEYGVCSCRTLGQKQVGMSQRGLYM